MPFFSPVSATFWPCSSRPVTNVDVAAVHALVTRYGVSGDSGVRGAQMGRRIYIVNRRGERIGGL